VIRARKDAEPKPLTLRGDPRPGGPDLARPVEGGSCYLVKTHDPAALFEAFGSLRRSGEFGPAGLVISRIHPEKVQQRYATGDGEYVWLTTNSVDDVVCASPTAISLVHLKVVDFLKRNPAGVVALDGAEYLITNNTFETFLRFVHSLHDRLMMTKGVLLIALDPQSVAPRELHLIARDALPWGEDAK